MHKNKGRSEEFNQHKRKEDRRAHVHPAPRRLAMGIHDNAQQEYDRAGKAGHDGGPEEKLPYRRLIQGKPRRADMESLLKPCAAEYEFYSSDRWAVSEPVAGNEDKLCEHQHQQYPRANPVFSLQTLISPPITERAGLRIFRDFAAISWMPLFGGGP